jgi:hypothetical protein
MSKPAPFFPKFKRASEALAAAKKLIRPLSRWTKYQLAMRETEEKGEFVSCRTTSKDAVAFCALGALRRVDGPVYRVARAYLREACKQIIDPHGYDVGNGDNYIFKVNDRGSYGHESVMEAFTSAIKAAKRDGK